MAIYPSNRGARIDLREQTDDGSCRNACVVLPLLSTKIAKATGGRRAFIVAFPSLVVRGVAATVTTRTILSHHLISLSTAGLRSMLRPRLAKLRC